MTQDTLIEQSMETNLLMMKIDASNQEQKQEIIKFAKVFIFLDLCIFIYAIFFQDKIWLVNTQVAFISSLLITIASFISYKKNIQNRLQNFDYSKVSQIDDRDKIDEIDDPFDLYSEYEEIKEEDLTPQKIKEIINEEKSKIKKNPIKNTVFSASGFLSIYRILGYVILIFGFFVLNNNKIFIPIAFIIGLGVVPLGVLLSRFKK